MPGKEKQDENLKAFEAALAALQPRTDRLDPRWGDLLAKEAALTATIASEAAQGHQPDSPLSLWERVRVRAFDAETRPPCASPAGHQSICLRCGAAAPVATGARSWAWPTALAGMTTVAAILLILLVTAQEPPIALPPVIQQPTRPALAEKVKMADYRQAMSVAPRSSLASNVAEASYLKLRDQVLRDGVESWKPAVSEVVATTRVREAPLNQREQLQRLLEQQGLRGS